MSIHDTPTRDEKNTDMYGGNAVVLIELVVIGLVTYRGHKTTVRAEDQADQLIRVIQDAGYPAPDRDAIIGVLGEDGGATCDDPGNALRRATLNGMLVNGAAGPGARPIIADNVALRGQLAIIAVYCPDELEEFAGHFEDYEFDDTIDD
jgi:hypothetical protein